MPDELLILQIRNSRNQKGYGGKGRRNMKTEERGLRKSEGDKEERRKGKEQENR